MQDEPWAPPKTKLPQSVVAATAILFDQGLADPRGCEYRNIEVVVGNSWSGFGGLLKTKGWVLPTKNIKQRFAVCWNGLVYPVLSVGDPADPSRDILDAADKEKKKETKGSPYGRFSYPCAVPEGKSIDSLSRLPLKTCLLLRLGESGAAERMWSRWHDGLEYGIDPENIYGILAIEWTWALFIRAVCAHMRGDDNLARISARTLVPIWEKVEKEAASRNFNEDFNFIKPIRELLADQERREKNQNSKELRIFPDNDPGKTKRIEVLIQDLEKVSARQCGQPGGVDLGSDPVVMALVEEGEEAIEPLLNCLENDTRLTRSVHFHRDFFRNRSLLGVHEAAYNALRGILVTSFFEIRSTADNLSSRGGEGRKAVASKIREYLKDKKDIPAAERWYRALANDDLSGDEWLQAAENITRPEDVRVVQGSMFPTSGISIPHRETGQIPAMCGEMLRNKKNPSVSELLATRAEQLLSERESGSGDEILSRMYNACGIVDSLAEWDIEAVRSGDADAIHEYAEWIRKNIIFKPVSVLEPMWLFPEHPDINDLAEWMFNHDDSPWDWDICSEYLTSPLVGTQSFQKHIIRQLSNKKTAGYALIKDYKIEIFTNSGEVMMPAATYEGDPLCPDPGGTVEFRVCDVYAHALSDNDGIPEIEYFWPEKERDRAVSDCITIIKKHAYLSGGMQVGFRKSDGPASKKDVLNGAAIFSLEGEGKVSVVPLPEFPMKAKWTTRKHHTPEYVKHIESMTKDGSEGELGLAGYVWQAEEVAGPEGRKRYYGFVGKYCIDKAPAGEIEFPLPSESEFQPRPSRVFDYTIDLYGISSSGKRIKPGIGGPLFCSIKVRNRSGLDRDFRIAETNWEEAVAGLDLYYTHWKAREFSTGVKWTGVPKHQTENMRLSVNQRLAPAEEHELMVFDLKKKFRFNSRGSYKLNLTLNRDIFPDFEPCKEIIWLN